MKRKNILLSVFVVMAALSLNFGCGNSGSPKAVVETDMGTFEITLYKKDAPNTVRNFIRLTEMGFYNNVIFHQVLKNEMVQTGDPKGDGSGSPGYVIAPEFNDRPNVKGAVGMVHGFDINSAGSQFYICVKPMRDIDGKYTVFGKVTKGFGVLKKINRVKVDNNNVPLQPVFIRKITIKN